MRPRDAPRWLRLASAALLGTASSWCVGASVAGAQGARPLILLVIPAGEPGAPISPAEPGERAAGTIAAHVRSLAVDLAVVREPARTTGTTAIAARSHDLAAERHAAGVLWVGAGHGDLSLYLYAAEGGRLFERRVPAEKGQTAAAVESLALIAHSASAELLGGKVAAMTLVPPATATATPAAPTAPNAAAAAEPPAPLPDGGSDPALTSTPDAPPQADPPSPPFLVNRPIDPEGPDTVSRRRPTGIGLGTGYVGNTGSHGVGWQNAFAVAVGWHPGVHGGLTLGYEFALPDPLTAAGVRVNRHPLFLAGGYRLLPTPRLDVELGGRAVADLITYSGESMLPSGSAIRGSLGPTIDVGFRILPALRAGFLLGMEVALNPASPAPMHTTAISDRLELLTGLGLQLDLEAPSRDGHKTPRLTAKR